jgi:hypothetical protein
LERLARDLDLIFPTLRLERDYIDAADRCLTQLTFTRRTQPACPVVVARCGLQAFKVLRNSREVELVASTGEAT